MEAGPASNSTRDTPTQTPPVSTPPPAGSSGSSGSTGFIIGTINSAVALVKNPVAFMTANKDATMTVRDIMVNYVAVLAAIPFFATLLGNLWYYSLFARFLFAGSYLAYAFTLAILTYILYVLGVYVIGVIIQKLATNFSSSTDQVKALRLSAFIFTPFFLISILDIIPPLRVLDILGVLYGLYILYLGLPIMLGTPKDKVISYVIATVIATVIVYVVIGVIVSVITAAIFFTAFGFL